MRTYALSGASQLVPLPPAPFIYYRGVTLRETAGATAVVRVYDGTSTAGTLVDTIPLAANGPGVTNYGQAKVCKVGLYVQVVSGAIEGTINFD